MGDSTLPNHFGTVKKAKALPLERQSLRGGDGTRTRNPFQEAVLKTAADTSFATPPHLG